MPTANITKRAIAAAMKQVMEAKTFADISISDITTGSGVSHKTFYYHFRDKYDLVNWIFKTEVMDRILATTTLANWAEGSLLLCRHIRDNKAFYTNAINATGQNCFTEFLYSLTTEQVRLLCAEACGGDKRVKDEDLSFIIDFYYSSFIGVLSKWVDDGIKEAPEIIVDRWKCMVDQSIERFIEKYARR